MSIKEYADSMNCTVQEILNKCRELGIKASDKDSFLEDDDIGIEDEDSPDEVLSIFSNAETF